MNVSASFRDALEPVLLAIADDELVIGHRHSEWTGWAPHIEEDIAFSSIAQDEIGHAALFYGMLAELGGRTVDELALGREPSEYKNAVVCERPNRDWAFTIARHFLYEIAERIRLDSLRGSAYRPLAEAAEKLLREERYHQLHADAWFRRISSGPVEGRHAFAQALSEALFDSVGLFEATETERDAVEAGILPAPSDALLQIWLGETMERIERAGLPLTLSAEGEADLLPTSAGELIASPAEEAPHPPSIRHSNGRWTLQGTFPGNGGRRGHHSGDFQSLWDDLTKTYREEPTATW